MDRTYGKGDEGRLVAGEEVLAAEKEMARCDELVQRFIKTVSCETLSSAVAIRLH